MIKAIKWWWKRRAIARECRASRKRMSNYTHSQRDEIYGLALRQIFGNGHWNCHCEPNMNVPVAMGGKCILCGKGQHE